MKKLKIAALTIAVLLIAACLFACNPKTDELKIALDIEDEGRYDELFEYYTNFTGVKVSATYGQDVSKLIGTKEAPVTLQDFKTVAEKDRTPQA